jgi:hypothetical protein
MTVESENAKMVLRSVWETQGDPVAELDEECNPNRICRNMKEVTFDGFAPEGTDLKNAWRQKLEREGKLGAGALAIRDLVLGTNPQN